MATTNRVLSPQQVYDQARQHHPALGLVTVYRTLERLEELGFIERVHSAAGCHAFIRTGQGHDHMLLCVACGRAQRFSGDDLNDLFASIESRTGYTITTHWLQLFGTCPECRA
jgi:Fe2+ or Zn2+ uptake regulation protein